MGIIGTFAMFQITSTNTHEPTLTIVKKDRTKQVLFIQHWIK